MKMRCRIRVGLSVVVLSTDQSVLASVFVKCWRVYVDEPVLVRVDLVSSCPCHSPLCQWPVTLVIPHSTCPPVLVGTKSYVNHTSGETKYYDDWRHTPVSCGTSACTEAISFIDDAALSDMKTGFTVKVSIYIPYIYISD
jgi:hypothetical protein